MGLGDHRRGGLRTRRYRRSGDDQGAQLGLGRDTVSPAALGLADQQADRVGRDRLEILQALMNGPAFDPLFRSDVITLPADHPVYEWACSVLECERPRVNQQIDLCGAHRDEWTIFSSENPGDEARAAFRRLATPLPRAEGYEPPPCRICPGRPAFANEHQLCTRHMRRWRDHLRRGGTEEDFDAWAAEQDALPSYGNCGTTACERMATTPLGLCRFHDRSYREQGQPGGARLPDLWERYYERQGQPVPVLADDIREFQRWCAQQGPPPNPNQINLVGLRPLVKAELQWGLEAHTRIADRTTWRVYWLREIAQTCREQGLDCLADLDLTGHRIQIPMIVREITDGLRPIYYTKQDSKRLGFIETAHFGRSLTECKGHFDLTGVPQPWLRDLLWESMAEVLESVNCPTGRFVFDALRKALLELGAFLAVDSPDGGRTPSLLTKEHADRFVADYRHRADNQLPSLAILRTNGQPGTVTSNTLTVTFNNCRRILYGTLESGYAEQIGLSRTFITAFPHGKTKLRRRRPFDDQTARALADPENLRRLETEHDPRDNGLCDIWETLVATGRRAREVIRLRLNCLGRYGNIPMLWHDQTKVGNYDAGIRIPEYLYTRLDERRRKTIQRFVHRHGLPPTPDEKAEMALFPSRVRNPRETRSISYSLFRRAFQAWIASLDLGRCVPHQARHTLATRLLRAGATLTHIRKYLGHISNQMAEHYVHLSGSDLDDVLSRVWVAGPGSENPGELLNELPAPLSREAAEAMAVNISYRCTPTLGGLCSEQVVVDGGRCPKKKKLDCDNCDKLVMTGADLLYWRRKREQWYSIAERAPDDATANYLHQVFEPTARAIDGLERVLAGMGLLDQALALDLRRPQDYFHRLWNLGFPIESLASLNGPSELERA
ncbi:tyrosine-type recombinase/integrase [Nonomuraea sp. NPDC050153]|uniref:tyrosine-type recombinase/integrase n=1 Tax=Nonomuraea sp. NPDC050153 TaxID=3364359 RepID=UPI00378D76BD